MENDKKQRKNGEIGDFLLYRGVSGEGEDLFQYDGSVLYCVLDEQYPIRITEIDGFYGKDLTIDINYLSFYDYIMHRASNLRYTTFISFHRTVIENATQEVLWV